MSGEVISLNVGGTIFATSVATLTQYPNSMLAAMFDPESERPPARKDGQGNFFIDRDPVPFGVILNFLRSARLSKDLGGCTLERLEWEADYFGLEELLKIIRERRKAEEKEKALELEEKVAEMHKKAAEAHKLYLENVGDAWEPPAFEARNIFGRLASEYEKEAAELRRD